MWLMSQAILGIVSALLGLAGIGVSVFAIIDNRRQRSQREKAVIAAQAVIDRVYGLLVGIKSGVEQTSPHIIAAINDGLSAINQKRELVKSL